MCGLMPEQGRKGPSWQSVSNEIDKLYDLLIEHGFTAFKITALWEVGILNKRNIVLSLLGKE